MKGEGRAIFRRTVESQYEASFSGQSNVAVEWIQTSEW
jgi:hypothetical protein